MSAKNAGRRLRERRDALELTRAQASGMTTMTITICANTIANIEAGKRVGKKFRAAYESALARAENERSGS